LTELPWRGTCAAGRLDGEIEVFDIWESQEALERFGHDVFIPILRELGCRAATTQDPARPQRHPQLTNPPAPVTFLGRRRAAMRSAKG
jgi:hypothetical protein